MTRNWNSSAPDKGEIEGTFTAVKNSDSEPRELNEEPKKVGGKHTAYLGDQVVGTRTSKTRNYEYAVVTQWSETRSRKAAYGYEWTPTDIENYEYYKTMAALPTHGGIYSRYSNAARSQVEFNCDSHDVARARKFMEAYPTLPDYIDGRRDQLVARHEEKVAAGEFSPVATSWHSTKALAERQAYTMHSRYDVEAVWVVKVERH